VVRAEDGAEILVSVLLEHGAVAALRLLLHDCAVVSRQQQVQLVGLVH
jgi:hypothetical protein